MTTDSDALVSAIFAHPGDDTPRLVYADWLEEHGQANYAEFIRLQCAAARHALWSRESDELWVEIGRVWNRLADEWWVSIYEFSNLDAVDNGIWNDDSQHGYISYEQTRLDAADFWRGFHRTGLHLSLVGYLRWVVNCGPLPLFTSVWFDLNYYGFPVGIADLDLDPLRLIRVLRLSGFVRHAEAYRLFSNPLPHLKVLDLRDDEHLDDTFEDVLLSAPGLAHRPDLILPTDHGFSDDMFTQLRRHFSRVSCVTRPVPDVATSPGSSPQTPTP
jgi:uncharacterized protein (TIGR02996 family)